MGAFHRVRRAAAALDSLVMLVAVAGLVRMTKRPAMATSVLLSLQLILWFIGWQRCDSRDRYMPTYPVEIINTWSMVQTYKPST